MKVQEFLELGDFGKTNYFVESVFGWCDGSILCANPNRKAWLNDEEIPKLVYADIFNINTPNGMMIIIEKMREQGFPFMLILDSDNYLATFQKHNEPINVDFCAIKKSVPIAVAIAAGLALGVLEE